ncbi:MAG: transcriptional repressor [Solirubrobacterales bacterium]
MRTIITKQAETPKAERATAQKAAIIDALSGSDQALSAQELHERLEKVGLATVYRNLTRLAEDGEIDAIRRPTGETAYRACGHGHHHHLICRECGRVVELHDCALDDWGRKIGAQYGFSGVEHQAELTGTCRECAAKGA